VPRRWPIIRAIEKATRPFVWKVGLQAGQRQALWTGGAEGGGKEGESEREGECRAVASKTDHGRGEGREGGDWERSGGVSIQSVERGGFLSRRGRRVGGLCEGITGERAATDRGQRGSGPWSSGGVHVRGRGQP